MIFWRSSESCILPDFLETIRLILQRVTPDDHDALLSLLSDPDIARAEGVRRGDARTFLARTVRDWVRRGYGKYLVWTTEGICIGVAGFASPFLGRTPDLGWSIAPPHRGHGYAVEAAGAILSAAQDAGLTRWTSAIRPDNTASLGVARRLGLAPVGWRFWPDRACLFAFCPKKCYK